VLSVLDKNYLNSASLPDSVGLPWQFATVPVVS
jgi:hypothetical protein